MVKQHKSMQKNALNRKVGLTKSDTSDTIGVGLPTTRKGGHTVRLLSLWNSSGKYLFVIYAFPEVSYGGEVKELYMTWEVFFLFCTVVIDLLALVVMIYQNNKKK